MNLPPEKWEEVKALFEAALERPPEERATFLDEACRGDTVVLENVKRLLAEHDEMGEFLERPAIALAATELSDPHTFATGEVVSGRFRVVRFIGQGGMGEVYEAEDATLGRHVALKFLPEEKCKDRQSLQRFRREARAASALNHSNICTVYEIGEHEGQPFIAMELLEGETLRDRLVGETPLVLAQGRPQGAPLQVDELLDLAIQIADGLEAAHQKGITHRDIKPANIFITTQQQVKILDFGLAKLSSIHSPGSLGEGGKPVRHSAANGPERSEGAQGKLREPGEGASTQDTPTASGMDLHLSKTGVAMGTVAYMSPEQARGEKLDVRTDVFSFGVVLYEMATGRQPFAGGSGAEAITAILRDRPVPPSQLNPQLPPKLEDIINKALEKHCEARYQHASDMRADLKRVKRDTDSGRASVSAGLGPARPSTEASPTPVGHPQGVQRRWWYWPAGLAAMLVTGLTVAWFAWQRAGHVPEVKERQLTTNSSEAPVTAAAISPDGKYLAYADPTGIYLRLIDTGELHTLATPKDVSLARLAWFPDGTKILASAVSGAGSSTSAFPPSTNGQVSSIWVISILGGTPVKLRDNAGDASVSPDGSQIAFVTGDAKEIWVMGANGENPQKVLSGSAGDVFLVGQCLRDCGRLFYGRVHYAGGGFDITAEFFDRKTAQVTVAFSDPYATAGVWLPDGRIIYSRMESARYESGFANLWEIRTDPRTGRATSKPRRITSWTGVQIGALRVTADGKYVALQKGPAESDVYVGELEANGTRLVNPRRLTLDDRDDEPSAWTLDGKTVLFDSNRNGSYDIFRQALDQRTAEAVVTSREDKLWARLSPDGAWIMYFAFPGGYSSAKSPNLMRAPISGGPPEFIAAVDPSADFYCARLPATRCVLSERHRGELAFYALDPLKGRGPELLRIDAKPLADPCDSWDLAPDGSRIAVIAPDEQQARIRVFPLAGGSPRDVSVAGQSRLCFLRWAADGKGWFAWSLSAAATTHIHVDLQGRSYLLHQPASTPGVTWSVPSPDGRHLAFVEWNSISNVWMLEGF